MGLLFIGYGLWVMVYSNLFLRTPFKLLSCLELVLKNKPSTINLCSLLPIIHVIPKNKCFPS